MQPFKYGTKHFLKTLAARSLNILRKPFLPLLKIVYLLGLEKYELIITQKIGPTKIEILQLVTSSRTYQRGRYEGTWEPELIQLISEMPEGAMFLDIGANVGTYSLYAASLGHKVLAIEPSFVNSSTLSRNIMLNDLGDKITNLKVALSNFDGFDRLEHHKAVLAGNSGASLNTGEYFDKDSLITLIETVPVFQLDSILTKFYFKPTMIKIDTDGNEVAILEGARTTLKNLNLVTVLVEVSSEAEEVLVSDFLLPFGFVLLSGHKKTGKGYMKNDIFVRQR